MRRWLLPPVQVTPRREAAGKPKPRAWVQGSKLRRQPSSLHPLGSHKEGGQGAAAVWGMGFKPTPLGKHGAEPGRSQVQPQARGDEETEGSKLEHRWQIFSWQMLLKKGRERNTWKGF